MPFEDFNDDGQVPSTPTLFVPHRGTDGFAEAINSPLLPVRFHFEGDSRSPAQGLAQLATQGDLGMDDTRINLMVGDDEASGRSVPTTPLQTTAPVSLMASGPTSEGLVESSQSVPATRTSLTPPPCGGDEPDTDPSHSKPGSDQAGSSGAMPGGGQAETSSEDRPGTSSGEAGTGDPSAEGDSRQQQQQKPIKRIVWGETSSSALPPLQQPPQSGLGVEQRPRNVAQRGGSRGRMLHRNVAYRGRGRGGPRMQQWK